MSRVAEQVVCTSILQRAHRVVRLVMYTTLGLLRWNSCIVARSSAVSWARASATSSGVPVSNVAAAAIPASPASRCRGGCHCSVGGCGAGCRLLSACRQQGCKTCGLRAAGCGRRACRAPAAAAGGRSAERGCQGLCHLQSGEGGSSRIPAAHLWRRHCLSPAATSSASRASFQCWSGPI